MRSPRWVRRFAEWPVASLLVLGLGIASADPAGADESKAATAPPQVLLDGLFSAVQSSRLFPDSKSFADAVPRSDPAGIVREYLAQAPHSPAQLREFLDARFDVPVSAHIDAIPESPRTLAEHIDALWDQLERRAVSPEPWSSALALPEPFVVPGGRFRELYYWDSYFTMLGLATSGRRDLVESMVTDFAYLIDTYGHVPNGTRTYYLSRSQPPFFYEMVALLSPRAPATAFARYLTELRREYSYWMDGAASLPRSTARRRVVRLGDGAILNRYWDDSDLPRDESYREDTTLAERSARRAELVYRDVRAAAESGWDFSSRWLADGRTLSTIHATDVVPVDLNSLLYGLEVAIRDGCGHSGDLACQGEFRRRAERRRTAINAYLWNPRTSAYGDYDWVRHARRDGASAAALYPLFVGEATRAQARGAARAAERVLLKAGGIVPTPVESGQQWDSPNGWAPLQWIAVRGFEHYGQTRLARAVACRWLATVQRVFDEQHRLLEKYDVVHPGRGGGGGEYPLQDGFGWTNGVTRRLLSTHGAECRAG